jgi:lipid-A-disaccharide synthase
MATMKVFFSVGEPSGDLHGANLIGALREMSAGTVEFCGYGGPRMAAAGCRLHADLTELAVMWFSQAIRNLPKFRRLLRAADEYFREHRPDALVLIDYPGFNWWMARAARRHRIPVFYYGVPQMWAWGAWRVRKMRKLVDHVLCKLPFEADWFRAHGCQATYVGHPYFDELAAQVPDQSFMTRFAESESPLVTILPGSRTQEVRNNLPWFLQAAAAVQRDVPPARFAIASFNERQADLARRLVAATNVPAEIHVARTPELIQMATCCWACSGSVSLELLYHEKPSAILYWVRPLQYFLVRHFLIRVRYITLVNLLAADDPFRGPIRPFDPQAPGADAVPFPEYPTCEDKSAMLARHAVEWLTDATARRRKQQQLAVLKARYAQPGASERAAVYIWENLMRSPSTRRRAA